MRRYYLLILAAINYRNFSNRHNIFALKEGFTDAGQVIKYLRKLTFRTSLARRFLTNSTIEDLDSLVMQCYSVFMKTFSF